MAFRAIEFPFAPPRSYMKGTMRTDQDHISAGQTPALVALLGFGEAGQAVAHGWLADCPALDLRAYDAKTDCAETVAAKRADYSRTGITGCDTLAEALSQAPVVFSLVTADQAGDAARAAALQIAPGALFFDGNSCAPGTKRASAAVVEAASGRYVDCAIMSPIHPLLHRSPMLISGPHADAAKAVLDGLGMNSRIVSDRIGGASSIKMLRSVMIKGIEALTLESLLSARRAGVEEDVIASLDASMPGWDWSKRAAYNIERTTTHGTRRAAEMREVVKSVAELGLPPRMAEAIVDWQADMGALGLSPGPDNLAARADAVLAALTPTPISTDISKTDKTNTDTHLGGHYGEGI